MYIYIERERDRNRKSEGWRGGRWGGAEGGKREGRCRGDRQRAKSEAQVTTVGKRCQSERRMRGTKSETSVWNCFSKQGYLVYFRRLVEMQRCREARQP